jgi:hypothetical protein
MACEKTRPSERVSGSAAERCWVDVKIGGLTFQGVWTTRVAPPPSVVSALRDVLKLLEDPPRLRGRS